MKPDIFMNESIEDIKEVAKDIGTNIEFLEPGLMCQKIRFENVQDAFQFGRAIGALMVMNQLKIS